MTPSPPQPPAHLPQDYLKSLDRNALKGAVIGVLRQAYERPGLDPEIARVFFTAAIEDLRRAGATIVDPSTVEGLDAIERPRGGGPCMGFKYDINHFLASQGDQVPVKNLAEIIKSRGFHPSVERRLEQAQNGPENGPESPACQADSAYRDKVREAVLQDHGRTQTGRLRLPHLEQPAPPDRRPKHSRRRQQPVLRADHRLPCRSTCPWATPAAAHCQRE